MNLNDLKARIGLTGPPLQLIRPAPPEVPDHELVRCIGQGSYGEVWLARNAVGTWRAVKVVYRDRFKDARPYEREFTGIQKYEPISRTNEGLIDVLQIGRNDTEEYFYYVMELADDGRTERSDGVLESWSNGQTQTAQHSVLLHHSSTPPLLDPSSYIPKTLAGEIRARGRLPVEECVPLGISLCLALGHLHRSGLIHRDVKPSNIIIVNGVPKLADIGLVTDVVEAQSFVGTEGFIPPEGPNSTQADLYALGKVLYEASMGKDRNEFPEPYTGLAVGAESKALMELNAVLLKACAPSTRQRYQTAEEMNADLALLHSGESVRDKHALQRRLRLTRQVAAATLAVMLLGVVPYYLAIKEARLAKAAAQRELEQRQKAANDAKRAQAVSQLFKKMLKGVTPAVALGRDAQVLREIVDETAKSIGAELAAQPLVEAEMRSTLAGIYEDLCLFPQAEEMGRAALRLYRNHLDPGSPEVAQALQDLGHLLWSESKLPEAEVVLSQALALRQRHFGNEHTAVAESLEILGSVRGNQGRLGEAERMLRESLAMRRRLQASDNPEIARSLKLLAWVLQERGKLLEAEQVLHEALSILQPLRGDAHPDVLELRHALAGVLGQQAKLGEAEAIHRLVLEGAQKVFGKDHANVASALNDLAVVLHDEGKLEQAEALAREALDTERRVVGPGGHKAALYLENLGGVLWEQNKLSEAEAALRDAVAIMKKALGDNPETAVAQWLLADVLRTKGNLAEAEDLLCAALPIERNSLGDHPLVARVLISLALVQQGQGELPEAELAGSECLAMQVRLHGNNWQMSCAQAVLGGILLEQKRYDEAEALLLGAHGVLARSPKLVTRKLRGPGSKSLLEQVLEGLIGLDRATGRSDRAAGWELELAAHHTMAAAGQPGDAP